MTRKTKQQLIEPQPVAVKPVGRPRINWTPEIEEYILAGIVAGKNMYDIVQDGGEGFPCALSIYRHIAADESFCNRYARARELQQDTYAEEIVAISDGDHPKFKEKTPEERKLAIETRKWVMGKLRPKKYNEKLVAEITGADGAPLIPTQEIDVAQLSDEARASLKFALMAATSREQAVTIEETSEDD
jgi:hypothetical protein